MLSSLDKCSEITTDMRQMVQLTRQHQNYTEAGSSLPERKFRKPCLLYLYYSTFSLISEGYKKCHAPGKVPQKSLIHAEDLICRCSPALHLMRRRF